MAQPVLAAALGPGSTEADAAEGWRIEVLDSPEPGAFLFADRSLLLSRGALAALADRSAFDSLIAEVAARFASGSFRADGGAALVEQPLSFALPEVETRAAEEAADPEEWISLVSGLVYGERPEFGVAARDRLLLPRSDLELTLAPPGRFERRGRRQFRARLGGPSVPGPWVTVRERPLAATAPPFDAGLRAERALVAGLASRLAAEAAAEGLEATLTEVVRVRGFVGVRTRMGSAGPAAEVSRLVALLRAPGALVEVSVDCGDRSLSDCEAPWLAVLETADRLWATPVPGPRRLRAHRVERGGEARSVIERLAGSGVSDASESELLWLNRGWLDRDLAPGDVILIVVRDPPPAASRRAPAP